MAYPKSEDKKIQKLSNILIKYADQQGVEFSFGGNTLYPVEALSFFGGLSLFLVEAKENYEKVYNNLYTVSELMDGVGKKIKEPTAEQIKKEEDFFNKQPKTKIFPIELHQKEEETFFGFEPKVAIDIPADFLTLAHFSHYTLEEYLKIYKKNKMLLIEGKVPLDPLFDKMVNKFNQNKLRIIPLSSIPKASSEN